ncbi:proto-oncogene serine/threonine-protein kinase mos [Pelomyxa schiedti]|nr:proto-oncogene serine/threonine-protein kinase mos [Pelomyxa schiedti]
MQVCDEIHMEYDYILLAHKHWHSKARLQDKLKAMPFCAEIVNQAENAAAAQAAAAQTAAQLVAPDTADAAPQTTQPANSTLPRCSSRRARATRRRQAKFTNPTGATGSTPTATVSKKFGARLSPEQVKALLPRVSMKSIIQKSQNYVWYVFNSAEAAWETYRTFIFTQQYWHLKLEYPKEYPPNWDPKVEKATGGLYRPQTLYWIPVNVPISAPPLRGAQPPQKRLPPPLLSTNRPGIAADPTSIQGDLGYTPVVLRTDPNPLGSPTTKATTCTTSTSAVTTTSTVSSTTVLSVENVSTCGNGDVAQEIPMEDSLSPLPPLISICAPHPSKAPPAHSLLQKPSEVHTHTNFQLPESIPYVPAAPKLLPHNVTKSTTSAATLTTSTTVSQDTDPRASGSDVAVPETDWGEYYDDSDENGYADKNDEPTPDNAEVFSETPMVVGPTESDDKQETSIPPPLSNQTTQTTTSAQLMSIDIPRGVPIWDSAEITLKKVRGKGGFSTVYSARRGNIKLAVKEIQPNNFRAASAIVKELDILRKSQNDNIIHLMGACPSPDGNSFWILTELAMIDLHQLIHDRSAVHKLRQKGFQLRLADWLWLLMEAACGIRQLHNLGIIHCDLKPGNILVTKDITSKIADMGLSKILIKALDICVPIDHFEGTANYTAPELSLPLFSGLYQGATRAADIFSFGMIIYEVISRCIPFNELNTDQIHAEIAHGNRPDLQCLRKKTKQPLPRLLDLIERCWNQDPGERPSIDYIIDQLGEARFEYMVPSPEARHFWDCDVSGPPLLNNKMVSVSWEQFVAVLRHRIPDEETIYELKCDMEHSGRVSLRSFGDHWDSLANDLAHYTQNS